MHTPAVSGNRYFDLGCTLDEITGATGAQREPRAGLHLPRSLRELLRALACLDSILSGHELRYVLFNVKCELRCTTVRAWLKITYV